MVLNPPAAVSRRGACGHTIMGGIAACTVALHPWVGKRDGEDPLVGMMSVLVAITIGSPIAWEHHYGAFLPVHALSLPTLMRYRPMGTSTAPLLLLSHALASQVMIRPDIIFRNRWVGIAGSHLLFGAVILFGLLSGLRACNPGNAPLPR